MKLMRWRGINLWLALALVLFIFVFVMWSATRYRDHILTATQSAIDDKKVTSGVIIGKSVPSAAVSAVPHGLLKHPSTVDQLWLDISKGTIVRLLAYFDTRDTNKATVQFQSLHDKRNMTKPSIYSKLYYSNNLSSPCLATKWTVGAFNEKTRVADEYMHYMISTTGTISRNDIPLYATLSLDSNCEKESRRIYIQSLQTDQYRYNYGVCLHKAIIHKEGMQPQTLLDWVKLNIALGAEIIVIYFQTIPESFYTILEPYVKKGIVDVLDWKAETPLVLRNSRDGAQTGVIEECIYYNMNRVKYLGLMDLDEFLVPERHTNMQDLLSELEQKSGGKTASFVFFNTNLYDNGVSLPGASEALKKCDTPGASDALLPVYFKRTQSCVLFEDRYTKVIVKPVAVTTCWAHNVLLYQPGYTRQYNVSERDGLSYHYRYKLLNSCKQRQNTAMSRYFEKVTGCKL